MAYNVMTLEEVAEYLRIHPSTVYRLLKKGQLPAFKVGSDWRFNREHIDRWRLNESSGERITGAVNAEAIDFRKVGRALTE
jgi:excisionase family DNA binding protein